MGKKPFNKKKIESTPIPRRESKTNKAVSRPKESEKDLLPIKALDGESKPVASETKNTKSDFSSKKTPAGSRVRKIDSSKILVGVIGIAVIGVALLGFLILRKPKTVEVELPLAKDTGFVLDHGTSLTLKQSQLSGDNSDLRYDVVGFFEDNVPKESFLKAMVYKENLDGKAVTPDLIPRIEAASTYNEDVKGWLRIKDSNVNIGVVQSLEGNDFYTWKGYDGKYSKHAYGSAKYYKDYGVAWAGSRTILTGDRESMTANTVIFGHNWENISAEPRVKSENDIMFEQLAAYVYQDYATDHPYINFSTKSDNMVFVVVAAFYTEDYWQDYNSNLDFNYITSVLSEKQTQTFVDEITKRSQYNIEGVELLATDKFLTLSTCTRAVGRHDRQRFAVIGKLMDEKDLPETISYVKNENFKKPAV